MSKRPSQGEEEVKRHKCKQIRTGNSTRDGNRSFGQKQRDTLNQVQRKVKAEKAKAKASRTPFSRFREKDGRAWGCAEAQLVSISACNRVQAKSNPQAKQAIIVAAISVFPKAMKQSSFVVSFAFPPPSRPPCENPAERNQKQKTSGDFHRAKCKVGHSWFRSSRRERRKGPYAVAVVVIATLKCAGGKKRERDVVR